MFALAVVFLRDRPEYMVGLILIGLARCIAMVIVWNDLAKGDTEYCAGLVAFNSIFQVLFFSRLRVGLHHRAAAAGSASQGAEVHITIGEIAQSVFIYLGIPFIAGMVDAGSACRALKGEEWYRKVFIPRISPITLVALLFTIVVMFSLKGETIVQVPLDVVRDRDPAPRLLRAHVLRVVLHEPEGRRARTARPPRSPSPPPRTTSSSPSRSPSRSSGWRHGAAFAAVIGPLVEVPVLIGLVTVALRLRDRFFPGESAELAGVKSCAGSFPAATGKVSP